ncbi:MAG: GTPase ObgE [Chlamydiia bacterium]|nr:GTPase ObgE [Chlamydiia bacterium]
MFVDRVTLQLSAGRGGNGVIAWRREKFIPKGGPAGGDGGDGGSLIFEADPELLSLDPYRNRKIIKARNGMPGSGNRCTGRDGEDLVLKVPLGTLVKDLATNEVLFDFTQKGDRYQVCSGGRGGLGNCHFKSSTHQTPYRCTEGKPGEEKEIELELKLIADVGFVGMPNAGKSTLISKLAHVQVKIAPYPFTTLRPNLGVVHFDTNHHILIADIPGILENAHKNKGLGLEFLRHIERTSALLFLIELSPLEERDPYQEFLILRKELEAYNPELLDKPFLVVLNKIDQEGAQDLADAFRAVYPYPSNTLFTTSALHEIGVQEIKNSLKEIAPPSLLAAL